MDILAESPGVGYKLCRKKLHWYIPPGNNRGCAECRRIYTKNKYQTDPVFRSNRIKSALNYESKNKEKINKRNRKRYEQDEEYRKKEQQRVNANRRKKWQKDVAWRERKKKYAVSWAKKNKHVGNAYSVAKRFRKQQAVPAWANLKKIKKVYKQAAALTEQLKVKYHVDHIYPLKSKYMCGLHVENNLQIILASENCSKGNRTWPGQLDCQKGSVSAIFSRELLALLND